MGTQKNSSAPPLSDARDAGAYSDEEAAQRRDAVVRRMIATPPKPHSETAPKRHGAKRRNPKRGQSSRDR
jgi:hypothetical protein